MWDICALCDVISCLMLSMSHDSMDSFNEIDLRLLFITDFFYFHGPKWVLV